MIAPDGARHGGRRDRFLWWLLALSVAAVVGLSAVASAFWTAGHGAPVPASVDVGPPGDRPSPPVTVATTGPGPGSPTTAPPAATRPAPAASVAASTATVVAPDRPVVQQAGTEDRADSTTTTSPSSSTSTTEAHDSGDIGSTTTATAGGAVPGDR